MKQKTPKCSWKPNQVKKFIKLWCVCKKRPTRRQAPHSLIICFRVLNYLILEKTLGVYSGSNCSAPVLYLLIDNARELCQNCPISLQKWYGQPDFQYTICFDSAKNKAISHDTIWHFLLTIWGFINFFTIRYSQDQATESWRVPIEKNPKWFAAKISESPGKGLQGVPT